MPITNPYIWDVEVARSTGHADACTSPVEYPPWGVRPDRPDGTQTPEALAFQIAQCVFDFWPEDVPTLNAVIADVVNAEADNTAFEVFAREDK